MPATIRRGCLAVVLAMQVAACSGSAGDTGAAGGGSGGGSGGGGGEADDSGGQGETRWCGYEDGPPCEPGAPCNPALGCNGVGWLRCQTLGDDCVDLEIPVCETLPTNCGTGGDSGPAVCSCAGYVAPLSCVLQNSRRQWDAANCSQGTVPCGDEECAQWLEVCIESDAAGSAPHCALARDLGCGTYDLADCRCLELEEGQDCFWNPETEQPVIRLADVR